MFFRRKKSVGERGEFLARRYLKRRGWRIVTNNLRIGKDEVDILALSPQGEVLALVEVRTTANCDRDPRLTVGHEKRRCMLRASRQMGGLASQHQCSLRLDLITVNIFYSPPQITHFEEQIPISSN